MNVPFEDNELTAITAAAQAAGVSARQYIRDAALNSALAKRNEFLAAAMEAYDLTKDAFAELCPEDAAPNTEYRQAEADAARRLAEMDGRAQGHAA
jgi:hypothetical protein